MRKFVIIILILAYKTEINSKTTYLISKKRKKECFHLGLGTTQT